MLEVLYIFGFLFCFAYLSARLSCTFIRTNLTIRMVEALFFSVFWFVTVPYTMITGTFFRSQKEFDEELYDKCIEKQIDEMILEYKGELPSSEVEKARKIIKKEIGTLDEIIADLTYFSKSISKGELAGLIAYTHYRNRICEFPDYEVPVRYRDLGPEQFVIDNVDDLLLLTPSTYPDGIDSEDLTLCKDEFTVFKELLGFHTSESGLTFLGAISDNAHPFFFIIYYDGQKLKSYVPKHNFYNKETRQPFGVDEEADYIFLDSFTEEETDRRRMYSNYKRRINPSKTLEEVVRQVNYSPRVGRIPDYGWNDVKFGD